MEEWYFEKAVEHKNVTVRAVYICDGCVYQAEGGAISYVDGEPLRPLVWGWLQVRLAEDKPLDFDHMMSLILEMGRRFGCSVYHVFKGEAVIDKGFLSDLHNQVRVKMRAST